MDNLDRYLREIFRRGPSTEKKHKEAVARRMALAEKKIAPEKIKKIEKDISRLKDMWLLSSLMIFVIFCVLIFQE